MKEKKAKKDNKKREETDDVESSDDEELVGMIFLNLKTFDGSVLALCSAMWA